MMRIDEMIERLQSARQEVIDVLREPKLVADMMEALEHSLLDRWATLAIGDARGEWDGCPHQLALSDLIEEGEVLWWRDEKLNVWYGLKGCRDPEKCGEHSPELVKVESFLNSIANELGSPRYDADGNDARYEQSPAVLWQAPCIGVREIDDMSRRICVSICIDGEGIEINEHDYIVGAGSDDPYWREKWPGPSVEEVVKQARIALDREEERELMERERNL